MIPTKLPKVVTSADHHSKVKPTVRRREAPRKIASGNLSSSSTSPKQKSFGPTAVENSERLMTVQESPELEKSTLAVFSNARSTSAGKMAEPSELPLQPSITVLKPPIVARRRQRDGDGSSVGSDVSSGKKVKAARREIS